MANTQVFSPNILGKRASTYDNEDEMGGTEESHFGHSMGGNLGKRFKLSSKFTTPSAAEIALNTSNYNNNSSEEFNGPPSKMARRTNENSLNQAPSAFNPEVQELKYQLAQYVTRMHQAELTLHNKERESHDQKNLNQRLMEELQKRTVERDGMAEENRILKRGIAIQETKLQELTQQLRNYEEFIVAAKAYIEEAEQQKLLKAQQEARMAYPRTNFHPPQPPPDVF